MQLAFITPTAYLSKFSSQGDFYLALAHLIDDNGENEYATFHRREAEKGRRVVLDNGLFEGAQVEPEALIERARAIKAQAVCAPDVLYDSKGTIKAFKEFIRLKYETGLVCDVMGIPQADNPSGWWECFQFMDMHTGCDLVGLSILSVTKSFDFLAGRGRDEYITGARAYLIRQLYNYSDLSGRRLTPIHLLGLGESYADVVQAIELLPRDIVSNDSSSCFVHGAQGIRYDQFGVLPYGKDPTKLNFDLSPYLSSSRIDDTQYNIDIAKGIANAQDAQTNYSWTS